MKTTDIDVVDVIDEIGIIELGLKNINCVLSSIVNDYFQNGEEDSSNHVKILCEYEYNAACMCVIEKALYGIRKRLSELYEDLNKEYKKKQLKKQTAAAHDK